VIIGPLGGGKAVGTALSRGKPSSRLAARNLQNAAKTSELRSEPIS
jgi:hypothetical protein